MKIDRDKLVRLQQKLQNERGRILADPLASAPIGRLPAHLVRELGDIEIATRAVAAEIARRTPKLGYGSEA